MKRVVITGSGTINSIGQNILQTLDSLKEGRCGISDLVFKDVERLSVKIGGQIHDFKAVFHCLSKLLFLISIKHTFSCGSL